MDEDEIKSLSIEELERLHDIIQFEIWDRYVNSSEDIRTTRQESSRAGACEEDTSSSGLSSRN